MQELRLCVKLRNTPSQTISKNVATGNGIDLAVLHRGILTLQAEINSLLTTVVENEKQNPSNNVTKKCANDAESSSSDEDEDEEEDGNEPPLKVRKR